MSQSNQTDQNYSLYINSQERYVWYFLSLITHKTLEREEIEADFVNIQQAFETSISTGIHQSYLYQFWESIKDYLWGIGFWQYYFDWGIQILDLLEENALDKKAWLTSELGFLKMEQGDFDISSSMYRRAKSIFQKAGNNRGVCAIERYQGVQAYRQMDYENASNHLNTSLDLSYQYDMPGMRSEILNLLGSLSRKQGDYEKARQYYNDSLIETRKLNEPERLIPVWRNLAKLEYELENFDIAHDRFQSLLQFAEEVNRKDFFHGCQLCLGETEFKLGNPKRAKQLAIAALDGFRQLGMQRDIEKAMELLQSLK